jgi:hypothetical protein
MKFNRKVSAGLVALLVLTGCGGNDDDKAAETTTTSSTSTSTSIAPPPAGDDKAIAKSLLITKADLPASWNETKPTEFDDSALADADAIGRCFDIPNAGDLFETTTFGNDYQLGFDIVTPSVSPYENAEAAKQQFRKSSEPARFPCVADVYNKAFEESSEGPAKTTIGKVPGFTSDENTYALRAAISYIVEGTQSAVFIDVIGVRAGKFEAGVTVSTFGQPPSDEFIRSLITALERKRDAANLK